MSKQQPLEVIKEMSEMQEVNESPRVSPRFACSCGENRMDELVWVSDDEIECAKCKKRFNIYDRDKDQPAPKGPEFQPAVTINLREIWVLQHINGHLLGPAMDDDGTDSFLAWPSHTEALKGLMFQIEHGYVEEGDCRIAQVK